VQAPARSPVLYPVAEVKSALLTYFEKHDLVNRFEQQYINVSSDVVFSAALYGSPNTKGSTPPPEFAKREAAMSALQYATTCNHGTASRFLEMSLSQRRVRYAQLR
jgi:hypothetical protein